MRRIDKDQALALVERAATSATDHGGCVMCALAHGRQARVPGAPGTPGPIAENEAGVVWLERFAIRRGHLIVVLRRHVERISELGWQEYARVQRLVWQATRALESALSPKRIFCAALGSAAVRSNSFPHHHVHVVPLFDGGEIDRPAEVFTWTGGVQVYDDGDDALELHARLWRAWPSGP